MRAQAQTSSHRLWFGGNLASSPLSSFVKPLPRIPVFQQDIKIPGNSPGDTNPAYARLPAWRAGPAGTHLELGFPAGLRSEML